MGFEGGKKNHLRRSDTAARHDKVVPLAHAPDGFHDLVLVIFDDLYSFQVLTGEGETVSRCCRG